MQDWHALAAWLYEHVTMTEPSRDKTYKALLFSNGGKGHNKNSKRSKINTTNVDVVGVVDWLIGLAGILGPKLRRKLRPNDQV